MLTATQIDEIRNHLENSQNPLFFFDNDVDGLCSFLLLRRRIGRGKGVPIRSFPELNPSYSRKINELNPDAIFILDKPLVSVDFLKAAHEKNLPVIWIDHHDVSLDIEDDIDLSNPEVSGVYYYNPLKSDSPSSVPTTYICYLVSKKKEDQWLALIGCIADSFLPDFSNDIAFKFPNLWKEVSSAFQGVYETQLGRISRIFSFALKDRTSNVVSMMRYLSSIKDPEDILQESYYNTALIRYNQINRRYQKLLRKARHISLSSDSKVLFFHYGGELSLSSDIANELLYRFPDKTIIVAYLRGGKANLSLRSKSNILAPTLDALKLIPGATGGGHKHSVGASMPADGVSNFKDLVESSIR